MVLQDSFKYTINTVTVTLHCLSQPAVPPLRSTNHKWLQIRGSFQAFGNTPQGVERTGPLLGNVCAGLQQQQWEDTKRDKVEPLATP